MVDIDGIISKLHFSLFSDPTLDHTLTTLEIAKKNADLLGIRSICIASTCGKTAELASTVFSVKRYNLNIITHNYGFSKGRPQAFPEELRHSLIDQGVKVITGTLAFSGIQSANLKEYQMWDPSAFAFRIIRSQICQGLKVCMEIAVMSCDHGVIEVGEEIIAVAGTGKGADTCCWIQASSSRIFEDLHVKALFTKPI